MDRREGARYGVAGAIRALSVRSSPRWAVIPAFVVLAAGVLFALARPVYAGNASGFAYPPPYPSFGPKSLSDWSVGDRATDLRKCRRVHVSIENPHLDTFTQVVLSDLGVAWTSLQPIRPYYGMWKPLPKQAARPADCLVTDAAVPATSSYKYIANLKR